MSRARDAAIATALAPLALARVQAGDVGLAHSRGLVGLLIRLLTRSKWNHAFVVVAVHGPAPDQIEVVQAEAHGVELTTLDKVAPGGRIEIIACPAPNRSLVVAEALSLRRRRYGFVTIASILFNLAPLPFRLDVQENGTLICSAVAAISLLAGGWLHPWPDLYQVTPAQLAIALS